ncbi:MAG: maleylpyruvate isomerase family mycothiol-dependent enzyme [Acidimicrobiales bacterium]
MDHLPLRPPGPADDAATAAIVAHAGVRARVADLLAGIDEAEAAATVVPACPAWSVTDTLAHVVGVCIDIVDGNIGDDVGTAAWADSHVDRFASLGVAGLLDRWTATGPVIDSLAGMLPGQIASQFCFDATTHEHDLRGALGRPGGRDSDAVEVGLRFMEGALDDAVRRAGLAPVVLVTGQDRVVVGAPGGPGDVGGLAIDDLATLEATRFDLLRSIGGRRSVAQVEALAWSTDPAPYTSLFRIGPLSPPDDDLVE